MEAVGIRQFLRETGEGNLESQQVGDSVGALWKLFLELPHQLRGDFGRVRLRSEQRDALAFLEHCRARLQI